MFVETSSYRHEQNDWLSIGFKYNPFEKTKNIQTHFRSEGFIHSLNQLAFIDTTTICISHFYGEKGSGKTTCIKSFLKLPSTYKQVFIPCSKSLSPINLLKIISSNAPKENSILLTRKPTQENIIQMLKKISSQHLKIRIILDNVEEIPKDTLDIIFQIALLQSTGKNIQFILITNTNQLQVFFEKKQKEVQIKKIKLSNFSANETKEYLKICLDKASSGTFSTKISSTIINKIHEASKGNINKINQNASTCLLETINSMEPKETNNNIREKENDNKRYIVFSILLAVPLLFVIQLLRPQTPLVRQAMPATIKKISALNKKNKSSFFITRKNLAHPKKTYLKPNNETIKNIEKKLYSPPSPQKNEIAKPHTIKKQGSNIYKTPSHSLPWIIQIAALPNSTARTNTFIQKVSKLLPLEKISYYETTRNNKPVHIVLLGAFENIEKTYHYLEKAKKALPQNNPWIRKTEAVNKEISIEK